MPGPIATGPGLCRRRLCVKHKPKGRGGHALYHYPWHKPSDPKSPAQRFVRVNFGEVSVRWCRLTDPQRLSWCAVAREQKSRRRLDQPYPLRGYYHYMRVNPRFLTGRGELCPVGPAGR
jgi:hypothetical protein